MCVAQRTPLAFRSELKICKDGRTQIYVNIILYNRKAESQSTHRCLFLVFFFPYLLFPYHYVISVGIFFSFFSVYIVVDFVIWFESRFQLYSVLYIIVMKAKILTTIYFILRNYTIMLTPTPSSSTCTLCTTPKLIKSLPKDLYIHLLISHSQQSHTFFWFLFFFLYPHKNMFRWKLIEKCV